MRTNKKKVVDLCVNAVLPQNVKAVTYNIHRKLGGNL